MKKVFLIEISGGEYDDYFHDTLAAFESFEGAKNFIKKEVELANNLCNNYEENSNIFIGYFPLYFSDFYESKRIPGSLTNFSDENDQFVICFKRPDSSSPYGSSLDIRIVEMELRQ